MWSIQATFGLLEKSRASRSASVSRIPHSGELVDMITRDNLAAVFRIWSNLIGLVAGLAIGHTQMALGAPAWVLLPSVIVGLVAGEMTRRRAIQPGARRRSLADRMKFFVGGAAAGGMSAFMSQTANLGLTSGAVVVGMLALVLLAVYLGPSAGLGAMVGSMLGMFYWIVPPRDSFSLADANGAFQLALTMACCAIAFGMIWAQRKLNSTLLDS